MGKSPLGQMATLPLVYVCQTSALRTARPCILHTSRTLFLFCAHPFLFCCQFSASFHWAFLVMSRRRVLYTGPCRVERRRLTCTHESIIVDWCKNESKSMQNYNKPHSLRRGFACHSEDYRIGEGRKVLFLPGRVLLLRNISNKKIIHLQIYTYLVGQ